MIPRIVYGSTGLNLSRIALGCFPFGCANRARGWDPLTNSGKTVAEKTVHTALDEGINIIDTAPSYGDGRSEEIVGSALQGRRQEAILATKVTYSGTPDEVRASIEGSLRRLRTDVIDIIQFHGGMYTDEDVERMLHGGLIDELERLREIGVIRFIGFTVEEPWTARSLIASERFDLVQIRFNLIYQAAALHLLDDAENAGLGVSVMRPMTSGILQRIVDILEPGMSSDLYDLALRFVLSDSRVHVANVGMRWPHEVKKNADTVRRLQSHFDMKLLPRLTAGIYKTDDELHGQKEN